MKKIFITLLVTLFLSSCATMKYSYDETEHTTEMINRYSIQTNSYVSKSIVDGYVVCIVEYGNELYYYDIVGRLLYKTSKL